MNILVIGCGKVGAALCNSLSAQGHDVSVISDNSGQFTNLSPDFNGYTTLGVVIDQDVLKRAGIENCDALAAVTSDDNTNLMVIQLAKEFFHVPRVFARVNDPKKNEVFTELGLETICPTNLTVATLCSALHSSVSGVTLGGHSIIMSETDIPKEFVGKRVSEIEFEENEVLVAIEHSDKTLSKMFLTNYELLKGDKFIIAKFAD
ncbi:MAG: potassium channel family protein [Oscillospiraceae bacterium]